MVSYKHCDVFAAEVLLTLLLCGSMVLGLQLGSLHISLGMLADVLRDSLAAGFAVNDYADVVFNLRLPRVVLAAAAGMGLALSSVVMQAVLSNPLADPYILGVSSGAALGAVCAIFLGVGAAFGAQCIGICAFGGALLISCLVLMLSGIGGRVTSIRLLLSGMALNAVCSGLSMFIVFIGGNKDGMQSISYWLLGNVANTRWSDVTVLCFVVGGLCLFFFTQSRLLNLLLIGSDSAVTMGVSLHRCSLLYLLLCSLLLGFIVYNTGIVGFIGLIVPHITRIFFGVDHWRVIPLSILLGGLFGIWADLLGRSLIPGVEIPFGVMLALGGGPFFLYLVTVKSYKFGGNT